MGFYGKGGVKTVKWTGERFCAICGEDLQPEERHEDPWECIHRLGEIVRELRREIGARPGGER